MLAGAQGSLGAPAPRPAQPCFAPNTAGAHSRVAMWGRVTHVSSVAVAALTSHRTTPLRKVVDTGTRMTTTLASGVVEKPACTCAWIWEVSFAGSS